MCNHIAGIYEVFCGHKNFFIGKQPELFLDTDTVSGYVCLYVIHYFTDMFRIG